MNLRMLFALASVLLISACASPVKDQAVSQTSAVPASASALHHYRCDSGQELAASYATTDTAKVRYQGREYDMHIAVSGSGARYVGGGLEWWTKGSGRGAEGTLFKHMADGSSGAILERCNQT